VSGSVTRVGEALNIGSRWAWPIVLAGLLGVAAVAALATYQGVLAVLIVLVVGGVTAVVGFRWPLVPLVVFVALIPIEEVIVLEGFGTLSRAAGLLFAVSYGAPRIGSLTLAAMPPAGWAYLGWAVVSLAWALSPEVAWAQLSTLIQLFTIALLVADFVVRRPGMVRPVLWAYSLSAGATALIGVSSYIAQGVGTTRSVAIQDQDPAQFAAVLLPAVVFGLYEVINGDRRILGGVIALLTTAGVIVSGTRGAWVAYVVVVLFIVLPQLTARRRIVAVAVIAASVAVVYQLPGIDALIAERSGNAISSGGAGRTDIWTVGLTIFGSEPVTGVGYANFPVAYTSEVIREAGVGWLSPAGRGSHSVALANAAELGVVGVALLALFLGPLALRRGWGPDAPTVQAALVSLLTCALFLDILANRKQVWLVIGLAAGLAYFARRERRAASSATSGDADRPPGLDGAGP
jgi:O-antigen ligase